MFRSYDHLQAEICLLEITLLTIIVVTTYDSNIALTEKLPHIDLTYATVCKYPVSETLFFLVFRIPGDEKNPGAQ
jgi:hypothetical protein